MKKQNQLGQHQPCAFLPDSFHQQNKVGGGNLRSLSLPNDHLLHLAEDALEMVPPTVLDKKHLPPSEDMRDYFSHSIYWWKNPESADGFPYHCRDGEINPVIEEYDHGSLGCMSGGVRVLSLAWTLTGREAYAEKAAELLRAWFLDSRTGMNPNMLFAQYIPGRKDEPNHLSPKIPNRWVPGVKGKGAWVSFGGVIEGSAFPALLEHVELLRSSCAWTDEDRVALQGWYGRFRHWLMTHQHGKDEASTGQNHAVWYHVQCARYAMFEGDTGLALNILKTHVPQLMEEQIESDGSMPKEYKRGIGLHYVTFTLIAFINLAIMGEEQGLDFWTLKTSKGSCLQKAVEWALPYYRGEPWPHKPFAKPFDAASALPLLYFAARQYPNNPEFAETIHLLEKQYTGSLTSLVYGSS